MRTKFNISVPKTFRNLGILPQKRHGLKLDTKKGRGQNCQNIAPIQKKLWRETKKEKRNENGEKRLMGHKSRGLSFPIMIHETVLPPGWFAAFFVSDFLFFLLHRRNSFFAAWQKNDFCLLQKISIQNVQIIS